MTSNEILGYQEASERWQIDRLLTDLAQIKKQQKPKSQGLTDKEKEYLCLLLLGCSLDEINQQITATGRKVTMKSITQSLSDDIYPYLNALLEQQSQNPKIKGWQDVTRWLEREGYRIQNSGQVLQVLSKEDLTKIEPMGWIWIGATKGTSQRPSVGTLLCPLGLKNPVTILPMQIPPIGSVITVSQYVNPRANRPQASSNYELAEQIGAPLIPGTRLVILEIDSYLELSINYAKVWAKFAVFND